MNRVEKIICLVLGLVLAWYIFVEAKKPVQKATTPSAVTNQQLPTPKNTAKPAPTKIAEVEDETPSKPEKLVTLENDKLKLALSTNGAVVKFATLKEYAKNAGELSDENPAVTLDFKASPLGEIRGLSALKPNAAFEVVSADKSQVVFKNDALKRTIKLGENYLVTLEDEFIKGTDENAIVSLSLGSMHMGDSKNDLLSIDGMLTDEKETVVHYGEEDVLKNELVAGISGGCSGSKDATNMPAVKKVPVNGAHKWLAVKNRFFVTALAACDQSNLGFEALIARNLNSRDYRPERVSAQVRFGGAPEKRTTVFYVGPKKQSLLWDLGMRDVMDFGMWRWLCYPILWCLDFFHSGIPNFGIAIILLTILVRLVFWPLTRKSTVGMKKMQELQPKMKELQTKFKDNPQRLQQETWQLYRDNKVNPMSSCLPMLIQIPVFIALFNVLRSAVELRYAPFLWITDLSEPEALFASWFPFGGLNLLPILMAVTTGLQSAFTPSSGDQNQQRMMMIFMPIMMLVMFYSFPSALSLYWFLSNLISIAQMWVIRRQTAKEQALVSPVEVIDPPQTRQMRRHG